MAPASSPPPNPIALQGNASHGEVRFNPGWTGGDIQPEEGEDGSVPVPEEILRDLDAMEGVSPRADADVRVAANEFDATVQSLMPRPDALVRRDGYGSTASSSYDSADRERRVQADAELLQRLQLRGYEGPEWRRFRDRLARYGFSVIRSWCLSGRIFYHCRRAGFGGLQAPSKALGGDASKELSMETAAKALHFFEMNVLRVPGRWDSRKGATLRTYFVGTCVRAFANVYRLWRRENSAVGLGGKGIPVQDELPGRSQPGARLELEDVLRALSPEDRHLVELQAIGHSHAEIGCILGVTAKSVERRLERVRKRLCQASKKTATLINC